MVQSVAFFVENDFETAEVFFDEDAAEAGFKFQERVVFESAFDAVKIEAGDFFFNGALHSVI